MKLYSMPNASREFARWRTLLRTEWAEFSARRPEPPAAADDTEWATTEWSETLPVALTDVELAWRP